MIVWLARLLETGIDRDWIDQAVGTPFVERGRSRDGWDCWGLVRVAFADLVGIQLSAHPVGAYDALAVTRAMRAETTGGDWHPVAIGEEQPMDVVVMQTIHATGHVAELHVGLVVRPGKLIHVEEPAGTMCVGFYHFSVDGRIRRIWRHRLLDRRVLA